MQYYSSQLYFGISKKKRTKALIYYLYYFFLTVIKKQTSKQYFQYYIWLARTRLKAKNLLYIQQLLYILICFLNCLGGEFIFYVSKNYSYFVIVVVLLLSWWNRILDLNMHIISNNYDNYFCNFQGRRWFQIPKCS